MKTIIKEYKSKCNIDANEPVPIHNLEKHWMEPSLNDQVLKCVIPYKAKLVQTHKAIFLKKVMCITYYTFND